jgi:Tfp pilus assembly protein PilX
VTTLEIVVIAVVVVFGLLALGGARVMRRRREATERDFRAQVDKANADLAAAHAADNGWDPERLRAAARDALSARDPAADATSLELVQVIDRPGTDEDEAIFRAGGHELRLQRCGDDWNAAN